MPQSNPAAYGGQAVVEGVMFAGRTVNVTAVRRKNRDIEFLEVPNTSKSWVRALKKIPFVRGIVGIVEAGAKGARHMNFAMEAYATDEAGDEGEAAETAAPAAEEKKGGLLSNFGIVLSVAVVGALSLIAGKLIFTLVPAALESALFSRMFTNQILHNLIEGAIKIVLLLAYIYGISQTPLIKRLFQYHGAEHKVIRAYEAGLELTVPNVQKFSTLHYRCGSSFIVFTAIVGVIIYSFLHYDNLWDRIIQRVILLPLVIGVSYEALRFTNALRDIPVLRFLGYPGLWLQLLTTKQPADDQVEVAIASFRRMLEIERRNGIRAVSEEKSA